MPEYSELANHVGFAKYIGLSDIVAIASASLFNIFSAVGLVLIGFLVDRFHISTVLLLSAITSTLSVFLLWGFAMNQFLLLTFSIFFGIFAGGYTACWAGCAIEVKKTTPNSEIATMVGFMAAARGLGCVLMGPLSEYLLDFGGFHVGGAYDTKYGALIVFTGITVLMGRFGLFGRYGLGARSSDGESRKTKDEERQPLIRKDSLT